MCIQRERERDLDSQAFQVTYQFPVQRLQNEGRFLKRHTLTAARRKLDMHREGQRTASLWEEKYTSKKKTPLHRIDNLREKVPLSN